MVIAVTEGGDDFRRRRGWRCRTCHRACGAWSVEEAQCCAKGTDGMMIRGLNLCKDAERVIQLGDGNDKTGALYLFDLCVCSCIRPICLSRVVEDKAHCSVSQLTVDVVRMVLIQYVLYIHLPERVTESVPLKTAFILTLVHCIRGHSVHKGLSRLCGPRLAPSRLALPPRVCLLCFELFGVGGRATFS